MAADSRKTNLNFNTEEVAAPVTNLTKGRAGAGKGLYKEVTLTGPSAKIFKEAVQEVVNKAENGQELLDGIHQNKQAEVLKTQEQSSKKMEELIKNGAKAKELKKETKKPIKAVKELKKTQASLGERKTAMKKRLFKASDELGRMGSKAKKIDQQYKKKFSKTITKELKNLKNEYKTEKQKVKATNKYREKKQVMPEYARLQKNLKRVEREKKLLSKGHGNKERLKDTMQKVEKNKKKISNIYDNMDKNLKDLESNYMAKQFDKTSEVAKNNIAKKTEALTALKESTMEKMQPLLNKIEDAKPEKPMLRKKQQDIDKPHVQEEREVKEMKTQTPKIQRKNSNSQIDTTPQTAQTQQDDVQTAREQPAARQTQTAQTQQDDVQTAREQPAARQTQTAQTQQDDVQTTREQPAAAKTQQQTPPPVPMPPPAPPMQKNTPQEGAQQTEASDRDRPNEVLSKETELSRLPSIKERIHLLQDKFSGVRQKTMPEKDQTKNKAPEGGVSKDHQQEKSSGMQK